MMNIYEGLRNKLDYASTKLWNMVNDFYLEDIKNKRFTPTVEAVEKLEDDLSIIDRVVATGIALATDWDVVKRYIVISDEFRTAKNM